LPPAKLIANLVQPGSINYLCCHICAVYFFISFQHFLDHFFLGIFSKNIFVLLNFITIWIKSTTCIIAIVLYCFTIVAPITILDCSSNNTVMFIIEKPVTRNSSIICLVLNALIEKKMRRLHKDIVDGFSVIPCLFKAAFALVQRFTDRIIKLSEFF